MSDPYCDIEDRERTARKTGRRGKVCELSNQAIAYFVDGCLFIHAGNQFHSGVVCLTPPEMMKLREYLRMPWKKKGSKP